MKRRPPSPGLLVCLAAVVPGLALRAEERGLITTADVLAILNRRCVECHGTAKQSSKLRLDSLDALFRGGKSGPAIQAGKSAESLLYRKVAPGAEKRMPPKGDPLTEEEIAAIRRWIDTGAKAAASEPPPLPASESSVALKPLPAGFLPTFCLAGDPTGGRLAIARGATVEVLSVPEQVEKDGKGKAALAVEVTAVLRGHADIVQSLAFSPDGKRIASGEFRVARVWNALTGELERTLAPHADRVLALAFSPDSKRLLTGGGVPTESGELKLWDLESGSLVWSVSPHSDTVLALEWSADGGTIITGAADRVTYLLEAGTGKQIRRLEGHTHHILAVTLSPDGKRAATAGADGAIRLWDLEKGEKLKSLRGHEGAVTSVRYVRDGKQLVSTGGDATVRFWNPGNGNQEGSLNEAKGYLQSGCSFASGKRYAAAEENGALRIYDLEKKKVLFTVDPAPKS